MFKRNTFFRGLILLTYLVQIFMHSIVVYASDINVAGSVLPADVTNLLAVDAAPGTGEVILTWTTSPTSNINTQRVEITGPQGPGVNFTSKDLVSFPGSAVADNYDNYFPGTNIIGLTPGATYIIKVISVGGGFDSIGAAPGSAIVFVPAEAQTPPVVESEPATTSSTDNTISWHNGGVVDPTLECKVTALIGSETGPVFGESGWIPCTDPNIAIFPYSYTFMGLDIGTTYYYYVQSRTGGVGLSGLSNIVFSTQVGGGGHSSGGGDDGIEPPTNQCGNSILDPGEECDDGNLASFDGCSNICSIETVTPPPLICGDGLAIAPEECDDGNLLGLDGCTNICLVEDTQPLADAAQAAADAAVAAAASAGNADAVVGSDESLQDSTDSNVNAENALGAAGDTQSAADIHDTTSAIDAAVLAAQQAADATEESSNTAAELAQAMQDQADQAQQDYLNSIGTALEQEALDRANLAQDIADEVQAFADAAVDAANAAQAATDAAQAAADAITEFADVQALVDAIYAVADAAADAAQAVQDAVDAAEGIPPLGALPIEACGNAVVEDPEECDDGNLLNGDGCNDICEIEEIVEVTLNLKGHPEYRVLYGDTPDYTLNNLLGVFKPSINNLDVLGTVLDSNGETSIDVLIVTGTYDFTLNGDAHLTKIIRDVVITSTTTEIDLDFTFAETVELITGDTFDDNYINAQDMATMLDSYKQEGANLNDLNKDADPIVNALDVAILIWNYKEEGEYLQQELEYAIIR